MSTGKRLRDMPLLAQAMAGGLMRAVEGLRKKVGHGNGSRAEVLS